MPRPTGLCLFFLALLLAACSAPTPTPTDAAPTKFAAVETSTPTNTPAPSLTPTDVATATTTPTASPSPAGSATPKPAANARPSLGGGGIGGTVYFMSMLTTYFSRLGVYPPEPVLSRPANMDPLTGLVVSDPTLLQRRPLLARLGNDPGARPQAGLNQADLVFEEIIDQRDGIFALTRFTAVFLGQNATVRPFRSARPINASLQPMFEGVLAHSGASKGGRFMFSQLPWGNPVTKSLNLDDLWFGSAYCQIGSSYVTRMASTVQQIHNVLASKGLEQAVSLRGFDFSPTAPGGSPVNVIAFDHLPWPIRTVGTAQWNYDPASGRYLRFAGGVPHNTQQYSLSGNWAGPCQITGNITTEQVTAANVVVLNADYEPTEIIEDSNNFASAFIDLKGSGVARIYRDGVQIMGAWQRPTLQHFFQFKDANGNVISLKPGNTWFEIAPLGYAPTIK